MTLQVHTHLAPLRKRAGNRQVQPTPNHKHRFPALNIFKKIQFPSIPFRYIFGSTAVGPPNKVDLKPSPDMFFIFCVPVCPTRFRPPVEFGDQILENPQNVRGGGVCGF